MEEELATAHSAALGTFDGSGFGAESFVFGVGPVLGHFIFHASLFIVGIAFFVLNCVHGAPPAFHHFGGMFCFLTIWSLTLWTLYMGLAAAVDAMIMNEERDAGFDWLSASQADRQPQQGERVAEVVSAPHHGLGRRTRSLSNRTKALLSIRDAWFGVQFACSFFVGLLYWTLLFPFDLKNVETSGEYAALTLWDHGVTWVTIVAELLYVRHRFSDKPLREAAGVLLLGLVYLGWNAITYAENGVWPYQVIQGPMAAHLAWGIPAYLLLFALLVGAWWVGRAVTIVYWPWRRRRLDEIANPSFDGGTLLGNMATP